MSSNDTSKTEEPVVLMDSDQAAKVMTVTGWVDRHGRFFGKDERLARYSGATHYDCPIHGVYPKNSWCHPCHAEKDKEKYLAAPREDWDGVTPIVIYGTDTYFFDEDSLDDYCEDNKTSRTDLMLMICEPECVREFDIVDYCQDILPEDGDEYSIPDSIREAADKLNEAIKACKEPVSWTQGRFAVRFPEVEVNGPKPKG